MVEPEKPFACTIPDCGMTFTNEDHLHVHTKKHDMVLQLGMEQKAAFVADQTPTPTRFIRNCEEVGLFQDLQNVNPFDEGFKRAMETKHHNLLCQESGAAPSLSDELHTPQMTFPLIDGDSALFSTTNNQRNITISRSSSDESGAIKEFETTTISKLTNEVTTISRIVGKTDEKLEDSKKNDAIRKDSVSYTNNVIKISSSNLVRKDSADRNPVQTLIFEDTVIKDGNIITKDGFNADGKVTDKPPILSQKSIDFIVDSLNSDFGVDDAVNKSGKRGKRDDEDYEVIIKLPNGKQMRMKAVEETTDKVSAKDVLKKALAEKVDHKNSQRPSGVSVVPIANITNPTTAATGVASVVSSIPTVVTSIPSVVTTGTLIPVTIVSPPSGIVPKVPIMPLRSIKSFERKAEKRKSISTNTIKIKTDIDHAPSDETDNKESRRSTNPKDLDSRSAASRRYRARLKETWSRQAQENQQLRQANEQLLAERALLKMMISEHLKTCPHPDHLKNMFEQSKSAGSPL